jgi:hypothetical protein
MKNLFACILTLCFFSASAQRIVRCEEILDTISENSPTKTANYNIVNESAFKFNLLKTVGLKTNVSKVRTDGIYAVKQEYFDGTGQHFGFYFYRFFNNGKVYKSCLYSKIPKDKEASTLDYGKFYEYAVRGEELIIETYFSYDEGMFSFYQILDNEFKIKATSENKFGGTVKIHEAILEENGKFQKIDFK